MNLSTIIAAILLAACAQPEKPRHRCITTVVTVQVGNEPLANVPFALESKSGVATGHTDSLGHVTLSTLAAPDETYASLVMAMEPPAVTGHGEAFLAAGVTWKALCTDYTFERYYSVPLTAGQNDYTKTIQVSHAIHASVRLMRQGRPVTDGVVVAAQAILPGSSKEDGRATIGGIAPGKAFDLFVGTEEGLMLPVPVPASVVDIFLPDIEVPTVPEDAKVRISIRNDKDEIPPITQPKGSGVTLVRDDGSRGYGMVKGPKGKAKPFNRTHSALPAGRYFVAPGFFLASRTQTRLFERAKAGENLIAAGVPSITVVSGQESSLDFDATQAEAAILAH